MATWALEHIPAGSETGTIASLATWGFAGVQIQFVNWDTDQASITARGGSIAFDAAQFEYKDKIIVWRDGVRFFHGWVTGLGLAAQPQESRTYTITGPSWWLEHLPFTWPTWPAKEELSLGERASFRWIGFALDSAINKGAPIAKDSGNYAPFILPTPDIRASSNCLEVIQRVARLHPMSAGWWDYSGEVPVFRAALRSALTAQTVAIGDGIETLGFTPLPDQQVESVHIAYNYTDDYGAHSVHNTAGTEPYGYGPNKLHIACDVETAALASEAQSAGIAPLLYASLSPLAWSGAVNMHETVAALQVIRPGSALSVAGGRTEWATMATFVQSVLWSVSAELNDICTVNIGPPAHLGPQDYLEFARAGTLAASSASNNPSPYDPPTPPTIDNGDPGTYDDLNGSTGGGTPEGIIAVQARGGSWELVGYTAYKGLEPTRRWRTRTFGGTVTGYISADGGISSTLRGVVSQSGSYTLSDTGSVSGAAAYTTTSGSIITPPNQVIDPTDPYGLCASAESEGDSVMVTAGTATTWASTGTGAWGTSDGTTYYRYTGAWTVALSGEDTHDAAISRVLATAEWGGATTAIRTVPVAGTTITGLYREARYRTEHTEGTGESAVTYPTLERLEPWQRYQLTVTLESRPVDSAGAPTGDGAWSAAGTRQHYFVADLTGEGGIDWQVVEPTAGYETRIASTLVEVA